MRSEENHDFQKLFEIWKPADRPHAIMIRWRITEWCNYACRYCSQEHGRSVDRGNGFTSHAFDNFSVEHWQSAFTRHFGANRLSITISGGEPFLDRKSMIPMLNFLSGMAGTECIRIDTNACWNPAAYRELDKSKIILNCSFHSSEIEEDLFVRNLQRILDDGFHVGMVNYVMVKEQLDAFPERRRRFARLGVPLNPNPDFERSCEYSESEKELFQAHLPEIDYRFKVLRTSPRGQKCLYPAITYELDFRGMMKLSCIPSPAFSLFDESLPPLPPAPVSCPLDRCECLDMYSFLEGSTRNQTTNPLQDYCHELQAVSAQPTSVTGQLGRFWASLAKLMASDASHHRRRTVAGQKRWH